MDLIAGATRIRNTLLWFVYRKSFRSSTFMAVKRKQDDEESPSLHGPHYDQLEMLSEEGNEDMDDFPQLNIQSESDGSETGYSTVEDDDDSEENSTPEIEPDYDSDSSTEDVSSCLSL